LPRKRAKIFFCCFSQFSTAGRFRSPLSPPSRSAYLPPKRAAALLWAALCFRQAAS